VLLALFNAGLMPGHGLPREWVVADRDGSRHMVSISASPLIQDVTGHVLVIAGPDRNQTHAAIDASPACVVCQRADGGFFLSPGAPDVVQEVSPNVAEILGYFPEDILLDPQWWQAAAASG
jgi:PAS domain-containing protein